MLPPKINEKTKPNRFLFRSFYLPEAREPNLVVRYLWFSDFTTSFSFIRHDGARTQTRVRSAHALVGNVAAIVSHAHMRAREIPPR